MKNIVYFAIFGDHVPSLPENTQAIFGGFGFDASGDLRIPYEPPHGSTILFDDSILPMHADPKRLQSFLDAHHIDTVVFDFEKPKCKEFCCLLSDLRLKTAVVPPQYARIRPFHVLVPAYRPNVAYEAYLQAVRRQHPHPVIDLSPICCRLKDGVWTCEDDSFCTGGQLSSKQRCMYLADGKELHFYDTKRTLLSRAASGGLPCLLPYVEFASLK